MKISLNWIQKYVDLTGITPREIAKKLTMAGIEVEAIDPLAHGTNLVTATVIDARLMENSDHLSICQVDMGAQYGKTQIVCGAPNIKTGQKVIVARPGAELKDVKIGKSSIRGHESNGMICSLLELGIAEKFLSQASIDGIEVLPATTEIGREDVLAMLGLSDTILSLKLLANRPDGLGLYNIAREIALLFDRPIKPWEQVLPPGKKARFNVKVTTTKCPQFTIRTVHGIALGLTPQYMKESLMSMGMRPINPLVDIANYVMLLTGQPLHIYDLDKLEEPALTIVDDRNQKFIALDGQTYDVIDGDIVIMSGKTIACLAGVMGSEHTAVGLKTKNIAIEAANFYSAQIRQTSIRLNLPSESSQRFIKGINPHQAEAVLDLTINLIGEVLGYQSYSSSVSHDVVNHELKRIPFTYETINERLGTKFSKKTIDATLQKVGIIITETKEAIIPAHRIDIDEVADLAEEVIRIQGFEQIDVKLPALTALHAGLRHEQVKLDDIRTLLRHRGLDEIVSYTLLHQKEINKFRFLNQDEVHRLSNPMTDEHEYVRASLLYSMLKVANYNASRQNKSLGIFEISSIETKAIRTTNLGIVLVGDKSLRGQLMTKPYDFYDLKGLLEAMMNVLGIDGGRYRLERVTNYQAELHPGQSATIIVDNRIIGIMGVLSPNAISQFDFNKAPVIMLELDVGLLIKTPTSNTKMAPLSRFPLVMRDLSIIISESYDAQTIIKTIRKTNKELIRQVDIFDIYQGNHIPQGKKSLALTITLNSDRRTLTEGECSDVIEKIKVALAQSFSAAFRT